MKQTLLILFIFSFKFSTAIVEDRIDKQVLVQVHSENSNKTYLSELFPTAEITLTAKTFHIWKLEFTNSIPLDYIKSLYHRGRIQSYIRNRKLYPRATSPNDSLFTNQWHHLNNIDPGQTVPRGINSIGAWDFQKGITTAYGDTIVVAVCDFGFDTAHEDLDYFINHNEIPYDGIDNDSNGAKDDYRGWGVGSDNHILNGIETQHGMAACGGIAAIGNNNRGVAGVAWNCKLLPLNDIATISNSIKAFEYCLNMKRLYHQSNKQKGAYIVAINYSLGATGFLPTDEPLWCAAIDSLGNEGILLSVAVENRSQDVETYMDMPVLCNSDYQINVTTYDATALGLDASAYSDSFVHLAGPHKYHTTLQDNKYGVYKSGASFAAPIVSGAIALMYSNFDKKLLDTLHSNPQLVTKKIKEVILKQVDITPGLTNKVVSNGKINLFKTITIAKTFQDSFYPRGGDTINPPPPPSSILIAIDEDVLVYSYSKNLVIKKFNELTLYIHIYDMIGKEVYKLDTKDKNLKVDLTSLQSGIYIARYHMGGQYYSKKLVLR